MNAPIEQGVIPFVLADSADGVCTLTLNRGDRFNPLSTSMIAALDAALDTIAQRCIGARRRPRGCGKGFLRRPRPQGAAGAQRRQGVAAEALCRCEPDDGQDDRDPAADHCSRARDLHGGGMPAGVDVRPCGGLGRGARFAAARGERRDLLFPPPRSASPCNIGRKRSMEMLLTGELIDAPTALSWGLVNRVVPRGVARCRGKARLVSIGSGSQREGGLDTRKARLLPADRPAAPNSRTRCTPSGVEWPPAKMASSRTRGRGDRRVHREKRPARKWRSAVPGRSLRACAACLKPADHRHTHPRSDRPGGRPCSRGASFTAQPSGRPTPSSRRAASRKEFKGFVAVSGVEPRQ